MGYTKVYKRIAKVTGVDLKVVAETNLWTCPSDISAVITSVVVTTEAATAVTQRPVCGVGIAAGANDIFTSRALTGFTGADSVYVFTSLATARDCDSGDIVKFGVDNGSTATTHTATVEIFGFVKGV